jgi:hypothetical protein
MPTNEQANDIIEFAKEVKNIIIKEIKWGLKLICLLLHRLTNG